MTDSTTVCRDEYHVIPRSCAGKLTAILLSVVPTIGMIGLSALWFRTCRQSFESAEFRSTLIQHQTFQIAKLIIDFNFEREMTAIYVTARSEFTQDEAKDALAIARDRCDRTLAQLLVWPPGIIITDHHHHNPPPIDDQMFRSPLLFAAILARHRSAVKPGVYFWDEVQYYTDIIDVLLGWFNRAQPGSNGGDDPATLCGPRGQGRQLWQLLSSYGYLLGAVSYIGAEQALCSVFHSVVCFSHRETFYYSNFSFAGEALFRLYRQSYPETEGGSRRGDWRTTPHQSFFPELYSCRQEILADLDYIGMTTNPSSCSYGRKNETRFAEVEQLTAVEADHLSDAVRTLLETDSAERRFDSWLSAVVMTSCVAYVTIAHVVRCVIVRCVAVRARRKRKEKLMTFHPATAAQFDQLAIVRQGDGGVIVGSTNDYYSLDYKSLPPVDLYSYHRSQTTTTATDGSNPCDSLKFPLENCTCSNHSSPTKSVALKVASV